MSQRRNGRSKGKRKAQRSPARTKVPQPIPPQIFGAADTDLVLAVVVGHPSPDGALSTVEPRVYGSAFAIADALFLTADHVLRDALAVQAREPGAIIALAHRSGERELKWAPVTQHEHHRGIDMALLRCPAYAKPPQIPLLFRPVPMLAAVSSFGYPHAVNTAQLSLVHRGFAGHVSTRRELVDLPAQPAGYELTFPAPGGLSGAPLLLGNPRQRFIVAVGWMIQSWQYDSKAYECGLAVATDALLSVESPMLARWAFSSHTRPTVSART